MLVNGTEIASERCAAGVQRILAGQGLYKLPIGQDIRLTHVDAIRVRRKNSEPVFE